MRLIFSEIGTPHAPGEFCRRVIAGEYFISWFETPFLYEQEGVLVRGNAGDLLLIPPGVPVYHGSVPEAETGFVNDWAYLSAELLAPLLDAYPIPACIAFPAGRVSPIRSLLEQMIREHTLRSPGFEDMLRFLCGQLLLTMHRLHLRSGTARDSLEAVHEAMLEHPERPWELQELAARSGYSVSRFSALYRERYGCAPKQDILSARISRACQLLRYTNSTVSETAAACGFQSIQYFSKYFRAVMDISPSEYARRATG